MPRSWRTPGCGQRSEARVRKPLASFNFLWNLNCSTTHIGSKGDCTLSLASNTVFEVTPPLSCGSTESAVGSMKHLSVRSVLVATDLSPACQGAALHGIEIAREYGATLHFVHVVSALGYTFGGPEVIDRATQVACRGVHDLETRLASSGALEGIRCMFWVRQGEVATEVEELARQENVDLIVLGTNCPHGLSHLALGCGERIFRWTKRPVLTVNTNTLRRPLNSDGVQHVLFATDFGEASTKALHYAASLSTQFRAPLTALHVVETRPETHPPDLVEAHRRLRNMPLPESLGPLDIRFCVEAGDVADVILHSAKLNSATLVVMGLNRTKLAASSGHGPSIAHSVVSGTHCPILTVRV